MAKFEKKQKAGSPEWMATYGDLVTLLLCFFIMLFAMSTVDAEKFDALSQAFNPGIFDFTGGDNIIGEMNKDENNAMSEFLSNEIVYQAELKSIADSINNYTESEDIQDSVDVIRDKDKITIRFNSSLLFESGKATLKEQVKPYLNKISKTFPEGYSVQIEGHTDNLKISNKEFASNWELSAFRGINVLKYIINNCGISSDKLSVAGYGEFRPIASNDTEEGRSKNRRVDIILFKEAEVKEEKAEK